LMLLSPNKTRTAQMGLLAQGAKQGGAARALEMGGRNRRG
jgi:hypothetical protein